MHVMKFCAAAAAAILFAVSAPGVATAQIESSPAFRTTAAKKAPRRKAQPQFPPTATAPAEAAPALPRRRLPRRPRPPRLRP